MVRAVLRRYRRCAARYGRSLRIRARHHQPVRRVDESGQRQPRCEDFRGNHLMTVRPDNRYADSPMVPVACRRCGACVLARKSSWNQTSVQWNAEASAGCLERRDAENLAAHAARGLFLACSALSDSIVEAVRNGDLPVVDETVPVTT